MLQPGIGAPGDFGIMSLAGNPDGFAGQWGGGGWRNCHQCYNCHNCFQCHNCHNCFQCHNCWGCWGRR